MRVLLILSALVLTLAGCQSGRNAHPLPEACHQAPDSGQCRAAIPGYYYDSESESCQEFTWGGCEGKVPFETMDECMATCYAPAPDLTDQEMP